MAEKPSKTAVVDVPARLRELEAMKGRQLIVVTNSFADSHRGSLPVGFHIIKRIGSDMHPDHGVMWGTSEYHATGSGTEDTADRVLGISEIPRESNRWLGMSGAVLEQYNMDTKFMWDC